MNTEDKLYQRRLARSSTSTSTSSPTTTSCRRCATARWWPRRTARSRWRPRPGSSTPSTCCRRAWRSSWPAGSSGSRPGTRACCSTRCPAPRTSTSFPRRVVAATAALNYFLTGKKFEKIVFKDHLPWVFQFGKDDDREALLVVFGQLMPIAGDRPEGPALVPGGRRRRRQDDHRQRRRAAAVLRSGRQPAVRGPEERRAADDDLPHLHHLPTRARPRRPSGWRRPRSRASGRSRSCRATSPNRSPRARRCPSSCTTA